MGGDVVRVLIVEDDPASTVLYVLYLGGDEDPRYKATVVDAGTAAIETCRREPPDCAIFDFQPPDTIGLELRARLGDGSSAIPLLPGQDEGHREGLRRAVRTLLDNVRRHGVKLDDLEHRKWLARLFREAGIQERDWGHPIPTTVIRRHDRAAGRTRPS